MMAVVMIQQSKVSDEVALFNVNSHMIAVMMIQHSKVSDEVTLFNVNSHIMAVMMIQTVLYHHDRDHMRVYIKQRYLV
jgi:hypothetical protein